MWITILKKLKKLQKMWITILKNLYFIGKKATYPHFHSVFLQWITYPQLKQK